MINPLIYMYSFVLHLVLVNVSCAPLPVTVSSNSSWACIWLWQSASLSVTPARCQSENSEKQTMLISHVSFEPCGHLFYHGVVPLVFLLLLSLSATMATAKDFPGPTTGKYPTRWSLWARFDAGSGSGSGHITASTQHEPNHHHAWMLALLTPAAFPLQAA